MPCVAANAGGISGSLSLTTVHDRYPDTLTFTLWTSTVALQAALQAVHQVRWFVELSGSTVLVIFETGKAWSSWHC